MSRGCSQRCAAVQNAEHRVRELLRFGARSDRTVDTLSDQFGCRVLRPAHDDARRPTRRSLDDDEAKALSLGCRCQAGRACDSAFDFGLATVTVYLNAFSQPELDYEPLDVLAFGSVPVEIEPKLRPPPERSCEPTYESGHALLPHVAARIHDGPGLDSLGRGAAYRSCIEAGVHGHFTAKSLRQQSPGMHARETEGSLRCSDTEPLDKPPDSPDKGPAYDRQYGLVHTSNQSTTSR